MQLVCHVRLNPKPKHRSQPASGSSAAAAGTAVVATAEFQLNAHKFKISNNFGTWTWTKCSQARNADQDDAAVARIVKRTWPVARSSLKHTHTHTHTCRQPQLAGSHPVKKSVCLLISQTSTPAVCRRPKVNLTTGRANFECPLFAAVLLRIWAVNWKIIVRRPLNYNAQWTTLDKTWHRPDCSLVQGLATPGGVWGRYIWLCFWTAAGAKAHWPRPGNYGIINKQRPNSY